MWRLAEVVALSPSPSSRALVRVVPLLRPAHFSPAVEFALLNSCGSPPTSRITRRLPTHQCERECKFSLALRLARGSRQVAQYTLSQPGRPATAVPCALCDSRRPQGRHHRRRLGRIILQQYLRLRHFDASLVAFDIHDHRGSPAAPRAHHGALPEQNLGIRRWR